MQRLAVRVGSLALVAGLSLGGPAPSYAAPEPQRASAEELDRAAAELSRARSRREAAAPIRTLRYAGEAGLIRLTEVYDSMDLRPEVDDLILSTILNRANPLAAQTALKLLRGDDHRLSYRGLRYIVQQPSNDVLPDLIAAAERFPDDAKMLANLMEAAGRSTDHAAARKWLAGFLADGALDRYTVDERYFLYECLSMAFGRARVPDYAKELVAKLDPTWPVARLERLFLGVYMALGTDPSPERVLEAAKPGSGLERYAMERLDHQETHTAVRDDGGRPIEAVPVPTLGRQIEAARAGMRSSDAVVRALAVKGFVTRHFQLWRFLYEPEPVEAVLELFDDPSPYVRKAAIMALHETVLRRGLVIPGANPYPLDAETMKMLRFPVDWPIFPRLVERVRTDDDPDVQLHAAWVLGIATGHHHGWSDIRLLGDPKLGGAAKQGWKAMADELDGHTPASYTVAVVEDRLARLASNPNSEHAAAWMKGVQLLTGRSFGYKGSAPIADRRAAIKRASAWFEANRDLHPGDWQVSAFADEPGGNRNQERLYFLARWSQKDFPHQLLTGLPWMDENRDESIRRVTKWWNEARSALESD